MTGSDAATAAERAVLGAALLGDVPAADVAAGLAGDYGDPRHRRIAAAIADLRVRGAPTVPIAVAEELGDRLGDAGGMPYMLDVVGETVHAAEVDYYAGIVREHAARRRIVDIARDVVALAGDADADTLRARMARAATTDAATPAGRRVRAWSDVATDPPVQWLVDGVVMVGGTTVLGGAPGTGKTLLALDLALRAAHGMPWFGRAARPASTIYCAGEGMGGLGARLRAWRAAHPAARPADGHYVDVVDGVPALTTPAGARELRDLVAGAQRDHGRAPDVVVVDTLAMAAPGGDENDAGAVGQVLAVLADVTRVHGCAVVVLHHLRKPQAGAPVRADQHALRGSSALAGAVDVVLLAGADGDAHALRAAKVRDGAEPAPMRYVIRGQDTGMARDDGRAECGPVVLPAAAAEGPAAVDPARAQDADVAAVVAAVTRAGRTAPIDAIGPMAGVSRDRGRVAVRLAVTRGLLVVGGSTRDRWYDVPGRVIRAADAAGDRSGSASDPSHGGGDSRAAGARAETPIPPCSAAARIGSRGDAEQFARLGAPPRESARIRANGAGGDA